MADELRGVIDRLEGDVAAIVFDDEQRLDLPLSELPEGARAGAAVVMRVAEAGTLRGGQARRGSWGRSRAIKLEDGQSIKWPGKRGKGDVWLTIELDEEDTAARTQRVKSLLDDIFKNKPQPE